MSFFGFKVSTIDFVELTPIRSFMKKPTILVYNNCGEGFGERVGEKLGSLKSRVFSRFL